MDSYSESIFDPMSLHKYLYANANPVMYIDPTRYYSLADAIASTGVIGILARSVSWGIIKGAWETAKVLPEAMKEGNDKKVREALYKGFSEGYIEGLLCEVIFAPIAKAVSKTPVAQSIKKGALDLFEKAKSSQITQKANAFIKSAIEKLKDKSGCLDLEALLGKSGNATVNPKDIRYMQSSIKNQTGEYTVLDNAQALKDGILKPSDLPEIRIWKADDGTLWTLDHRRLAAFRIAGIDEVPFRWATDEEVAKQMWKMSTKTAGTSIKLKLGNGKSIIIGD